MIVDGHYRSFGLSFHEGAFYPAFLIGVTFRVSMGNTETDRYKKAAISAALFRVGLAETA
jgi:ABC-type uncharacterized transport system YnjBCD ATPase subunit